MRNRALHQALIAFAEEAAWQLAADAADGEGVPFEVVEASGRASRTPLYCYRPLTGEFIRRRIGVLGRLPSYAPAARALEELAGLDDYLRARGEPRIPADPRDRADATLRTFLGTVFADASEFLFSADRFERAYAELEGAVYRESAPAVVVAPLLGVDIASAEVTLGDGLALLRAGELEDLPPEIERMRGEGDRAPVLVALASHAAPGEQAPVTAARVRFRRLLTALRLFDRAGVALGPAGWSRSGAGPWQLVPLGGTGRPRGTLSIPPAQEDELRAFCSLVSRRMPRGGELAWALARYEMGCERIAPFEALTDHLLALRALLEPEGPGSGRLAGRLAAICAVPGERAALAERVAHAISLERAVIAGLAPAEPGVDRLVEEVSDHLRALLRDVLCGHLDSDLRGVADELLAEAVTVA